jgi:hypothetical protein
MLLCSASADCDKSNEYATYESVQLKRLRMLRSTPLCLAESSVVLSLDPDASGTE